MPDQQDPRQIIPQQLTGIPGLDAMRQGRYWDWFKGLAQGPDPTVAGNPMMIPTEANLPQFAAKMREMLEQSKPLPQAGREPLEALKDRLIQAWLSVRYPKRAAIPNSLSYDRDIYNVGEFRPEKGWDWDSLQQGKRSIKGDIKISTYPQSPMRSANVLGHEVQHAVDYNRNPEVFRDYPKWPGYRSIEYQNAYLTHPTEIAARQAGETTQKSLQRFLGQVPNVSGQAYRDINYNSKEFVDFLYNWLNKGR